MSAKTDLKNDCKSTLGNLIIGAFGKKAIKIAPKQKEAHNYLANLYYMRGEYYKALKEYEIVLELSPNNQVILEKIRVLKQLVKNSIQ